MIDRLDQWHIFACVAKHKSFVKAARTLGRSPQATTRAVLALETRIGSRLLNRTTRAVSLTPNGERYLERCGRALAEVDLLEAPLDAEAPLSGSLTITAPVLFGRLHVLPVVTELLEAHAGVDARFLLIDRVVSLAEEGIDVALRIGALPDSPAKARLVGEVKSVVCASPAYLARAARLTVPEALADHACIAFTGTSPIADRWSFRKVGERERRIAVRPRLTVNSGEAAIEAALAGLGVVRLLSYQVEEWVKRGKLKIVLRAFEPEPAPVHLLRLPGHPSRPAAAFVDLAVVRLRDRLAKHARAFTRS